METYVAALDQGTTSSRAILFNQAGEIVARSQHPFRQIYPQPGWVEHDPMEIWATTARALAEAVDSAHIDPKQIAAVGITTSGRPLFCGTAAQENRSATPSCGSAAGRRPSATNSRRTAWRRP